MIFLRTFCSLNPGVNPTKLSFFQFSDFCCWAWVFVRTGKICIHEKWSSLSAKNRKILCFRRKKFGKIDSRGAQLNPHDQKIILEVSVGRNWYDLTHLQRVSVRQTKHKILSFAGQIKSFRGPHSAPAGRMLRINQNHYIESIFSLLEMRHWGSMLCTYGSLPIKHENMRWRLGYLWVVIAINYSSLITNCDTC